MLDQTLLQHLEPEQFYRQWMQTYAPVRPDGRKIDQPLPLNIQPGAVGTADGSALVRLGCTTVITGVKAEVSEGLLDDPRRGFIVPNVHFAAGAHAKIRPGPPSEVVQSLTHRIDECLSRFRVVDPAKLIVQEGLVWVLYIDIVVLNDEGSVWDAIWHSITAALEDTLLPVVAIDATAGLVTIVEESKSPLELECRPIPVSALYYPENGCYLLHPTASETALSSAAPVELLFDRTSVKTLYSNREASRRVPESQFPADNYKSIVLQLLQ